LVEPDLHEAAAPMAGLLRNCDHHAAGRIVAVRHGFTIFVPEPVSRGRRQPDGKPGADHPLLSVAGSPSDSAAVLAYLSPTMISGCAVGRARRGCPEFWREAINSAGAGGNSRCASLEIGNCGIQILHRCTARGWQTQPVRWLAVLRDTRAPNPAHVDGPRAEASGGQAPQLRRCRAAVTGPRVA
jgi:hypothetical protein